MAIPLPRVVSDVGPGGALTTGLQGSNALQISNAKARYAPYTEMANALSKIAYSQVALPDALAKFMMSPAAAQMSRDEQIKLNNLFQGYVNNMPNTSNMFNQLNPQNTPGNRLLNMFMDKVGGGQGSQGNALSPGQQAFEQIKSNPELMRQYQKNGQVTIPGQEEPVSNGVPAVQTNAGVGPATSAGKQAANLIIPGTQGGNNPNVAADVQKEQAMTAGKGQTQTQVDLMKQTLAGAQSLGNSVKPFMNAAEGFLNHYDKSYYTGARAGSVPTKGFLAAPTLPGNDLSDEQLTKNYANQASAWLSRLLNGPGHINDSLRSQAETLKFEITNDPKAAKENVFTALALGDRFREYSKFTPYIARKNADINSDELDGLFNDYQYFVPNFDYKSGKAIPQNKDMWRVFTSPEALQIYRDTGEFHPTNLKKLKNGKIAFTYNGKVYVE